jgi:hypothetical protein
MTDREPDPDATAEFTSRWPQPPDLWPKLLPPPELVSPAVDDELVITLRLRLSGPDIAHRVAKPAFDYLPGRLRVAVSDFLDPGDVDLAGLEIALPDFRPYGTSGGVTHEFAGPAQPKE